ncbi:seminal fluid protein 24F [Haemaphysalis longicornis]
MALLWTGILFALLELHSSLAAKPSVLPTARWAVSKFRRGRALLPGADTVDGITSVAWCFSACLRVPTCRAFNYGKATCQLLQQELCHQAGLKLTVDPRLNYYDLQEHLIDERTGPLWKTPFCSEDGFCSPACEPLLHIPRLNEVCDRDFECQMRTGPQAVCRKRLCKCAEGYFIASNTTCEQLPVSGYSLFPGAVEGSYIRLSTTEANFTRASAECARDAPGAELAYVADGDTNRFLRELMRRAKVRSAFIGLTDEQQEGVWLWVANSQKLRTTQFWRPGAPDNANDGEHCAQMSNEIDFGWDDVPCSTEGRYFCQLPHPN